METVIKQNNAKITLHLEDCIGGIPKALVSETVDVVVTSPPYNIGIQYGTYNDGVSRREYLDWLESWAAVVKTALAPQGSLFLNIGSKPSDPWVPFEVATVMRNHFQLQNVIHWIKSISIENDSYGERTSLSFGHYKPINSKRYVNDTHEYVFHFTKTGTVQLDRLAVGVPYKDKSNVTRWDMAKADRRCRGNTWYIPYQTIRNRNSDRPHPATFPVQLATMCIKLHGRERTRLVLDPFMGIGTTALACLELGIDCVGFEIDKDYFQEACRRIESRHLFSRPK